MQARIQEFFTFVVARSQNRETAEGRSRDRYSRIARSAMADMVAQMTTITIGVVTVPIALSYLGAERFGLWMALTSTVTFLAFSDLGLGIGLQNMLSGCNGQNDQERPRLFISSTLLVMMVIFALFIALAFFVLPHLPLQQIFKLQTPVARQELLPTAQALLIAFGLGVPTGLIQRIYNGYQQGYWGSLGLTAGRILSLTGLIVGIAYHATLPVLALTFMGTPYLVLGLWSLYFFKNNPSLRPSLRHVNWDAIRKVSHIGIVALGAQIAALLLTSGIPLVLSSALGAASVTSFVVTMRLVGTVNVMLTTLATPLWPAYGEAAAKGDWQWVRETYRHANYYFLRIYVPLLLALLCTGRWIIEKWTKNQAAVPSLSLLGACGLWGLLWAWNVKASMLLNGLNHMKGQASYGTLLAVAGLLAGYFAAPFGDVSGVVWVILFIGLFLRCVMMSMEVRRVLNRLN